MNISELNLVPSEEAKICLFCPKKKCTYGKCKRLKFLKNKNKGEKKS